MKSVRATVATLVLAIITPSAMAIDGNALLDHCNKALSTLETGEIHEKIDMYGVGLCFGYTEGVRSSMAIYKEIGRYSGPMEVCIPKGVNNGQGVRVVIKFLEDNPQMLQYDAVALIMKAYTDNFPCK